MENSNFHSLKATVTFTQHQLIPVGNYCSERGSHEVCMREDPLQFPPITHKPSQGTLDADTTASCCLKDPRCTQPGANDDFRAIKTTQKAPKTWKHDVYLRWFCSLVMLCILFAIWNTLDTCSWLENACEKGAFKQNSHAKIQLKEKKKNANGCWSLNINSTKTRNRIGDKLKRAPALVATHLLTVVKCRWAWTWGFNYESAVSLYGELLHRIKVSRAAHLHSLFK